MATVSAMFTITDTGDLNGRNLIQRSFFTKDPWTGPTYNAVGDGFGTYHDKYCLPVTTNYLYSNTHSGKDNLFPDLAFEEGVRYTISGKWAQFRTDTKYNRLYLSIHHTDGTNVTAVQSKQNNVWSSFKLTSTAGKTVDKITMTYGEYGTTYIADFKLEVGAAATGWTPAPEDVNDAYITANYSKDEIDGLEVGGRNLILKGDEEHTRTVTTEGGNTIIPLYSFSLYGQPLAHDEGQTMTISFEYESSGNSLDTGRIYVQHNGTQIASTQNANIYLNTAPSGRYIRTYTITSDQAASTSNNYVRVYIVACSAGTIVTVKNMKVELGNRVTDWTPAPEDTDAAIADVDEKADAADTKASTALETATGAVTALNDYIAGNEIVVGTQTAATNAWTGKAGFSELVNGQGIAYWLPYAGTSTAATLKLTLADNSETAAIPVYYKGTTRATTHFTAGTVVHLTYRENADVAGTTVEKGWWADASYDSGNTNYYDRIRLNNTIKAKSAISASHFIVSDDGGYFHLAGGSVFDITKPILWCSTAISAGRTGSDNYISLPSLTLRNNASGITLTANKTCYLVGTLTGKTFTVKSSGFFTSTVPTSDDGYYYISLGYLYSTYQIYLYPEHPIYKFVNGSFKSLNQVAYEASVTAESKNSVYYQATAPTGNLKDGDTWFDTSKDYKISRWNAGTQEWAAAELGNQAVGNLDASHINTGTLTAVHIEAGKARDIAGTIKVYDEDDDIKVSLDKDGLVATKGIVGGWNIGEKTLESDHVSGVDESGVEHTGKSILDVEGGLEIVGSSTTKYTPDIYQRDWGHPSVSLWGESHIGPRSISSEYLVANDKSIAKGGFWIPGRNISAWYTLTPRKQIANTGMYFTLYTKGDLSLFWLILDGKTPEWTAGVKNNVATSLVDYVDSPTAHFINSVQRSQVAPPYTIWLVNGRGVGSQGGRGGVCNNMGQEIQPYINMDGYINIWQATTSTGVAAITANVFWAHIDYPYTES